MEDVLDIFHPCTKAWFHKALGAPTAVQVAAWPEISKGKNTLVSAPTGTGKTLTSFLVFIDKLKGEARAGTLKNQVQLIYISPLKALAGDIRENLRKPLDGIKEEEEREGIADSKVHEVVVGIRTGDTTQNERNKMLRTPPHILITTPESLYLLLTSKNGEKMISTARWIILDELHAMIDSKRGAHLMLSLARLDQICQRTLQRIGLSATIEPVSLAAEYLSPDKTAIIKPPMSKKIEIKVATPLEYDERLKLESVWQDIAATIIKHSKSVRNMIVFVEARRYAEKLAHFINEQAGENYSRCHHGSLSKNQRFEIEESLRRGKLKILCATSSMELGIDVGDIDQVIQVGCPRSISSTMQRLGRSGHKPGSKSVMYIYPRASAEGLYCGLTAEVANAGGVEYSRPPRLCLDVLAQHLVSMAAVRNYTLDDIMALLKRAYPFREVTKEDVKKVLCMLAGDYEHESNIPVRPRVLYDRIHECVEGDNYSRMLAVMSGGTIPDRGLYTCKTQNGVKVGELEEEFVFESRVGDTFLLGTFSWMISKIGRDDVIVVPANGVSARLPFWKGEIKGRKFQVGLTFGRILRRLNEIGINDKLFDELTGMGLDDMAAERAVDFIQSQVNITGVLPDDRTILVEHFKDETGNDQMMVHSVFGRRVNTPLALLAAEMAKRQVKMNVNMVEDDDGFLLFPFETVKLPEGLLKQINPNTANRILSALLPATSLYNITFRDNSGRALMMGMRSNGRQPLWVQRVRSAQMLESLVRIDDHPLMRETRRECMEDYWDMEGLDYVLNGIQSGAITVREMFLEYPSPMSLPLRQQTEGSLMYEYTPTPSGIYQAVEEALAGKELIAPDEEALKRAIKRIRMPENEKQLHSFLMVEGDFMEGELEIPIQWLETLLENGQVSYIEPGIWIAAENQEKYERALYEHDKNETMRIILRLLRYHGGQGVADIARRYFLMDDFVLELLHGLIEDKLVIKDNGLYYHADVYETARNETIRSRRKQVQTLPSSRYAALLAGRVRNSAPPAQQLEHAMEQLCGRYFSPEVWENYLLPVRVNGYRGELLDAMLARGEIFWHMISDKEVTFLNYEDLDWDQEILFDNSALSDDERAVYEALRQRGASFIKRLSQVLGGKTPYDALLSLAHKGMVSADSFTPVRQKVSPAKERKRTPRARVSVRVNALQSGRWELAHPLLELTAEERIDRAFEQAVILCRETITGISWTEAYDTLQIWELTGRVRRGYFVEGLSGVQYIREQDYSGTILSMQNPDKEILWLSAVDPAQPWGKYFPHIPDRSFLNVPGTAVALKEGIPVAALEKKGKCLRVFEEEHLESALSAFVLDFNKKRIYKNLKRMVLKEAGDEYAAILKLSGFQKEMSDLVLYRKTL